MQSHWPSGSHIKQSKQEKQTKAPEERRPERESRRSASRRRRRHFPSSCPSPSHHCQGNTWLFYTAEIRTQARVACRKHFLPAVSVGAELTGIKRSPVVTLDGKDLVLNGEGLASRQHRASFAWALPWPSYSPTLDTVMLR